MISGTWKVESGNWGKERSVRSVEKICIGAKLLRDERVVREREELVCLSVPARELLT